VDLLFECQRVVFELEDSGSNPSGMTQVYLYIYIHTSTHMNLRTHTGERERESVCVCVCVCYARPIFLNPLTFLHAMQCIHVYRNNTSFSTLISIISQIHIFFQFINSVSIIHTCIYFMYVDHQYHFYTTFSQLGLIMHSIPLLKLPVYE